MKKKIQNVILLFLCVFITVQVGNWVQFSFLVGQKWAILGSTALLYFVIFLCVLAFVRKDKISFKKLGFRKVANWKSLMLAGGLVGFVAQLTIFLLVASISTIFFFEYFGYSIVTPLHFFIPFLLVGGPVAAIVEEAAFRGYIQRTLTARHGFTKALVITSVLFAVTHIIFYVIYLASIQGVLKAALKYYLVGTLLSLLPLGFFMGYTYRKTGQNLICPISIHTMYNAFGLFLISYSTYALSLYTIGYLDLILVNLVRIGITAVVLWALLRKICRKS